MDFLDKDLFEKDLESIALWLNVESVSHVHVKIKKIDISLFENQIKEMNEQLETQITSLWKVVIVLWLSNGLV